MAPTRWHKVATSCSNIKASIDFEENIWLLLLPVDQADRG